MKGIIFDIKHYSINDGPGIRTTLFFKGCPLTCPWCHNPESQKPEIETVKHHFKISEHSFCDPQQVGKEYTVDEVVFQIEKDRLFYDESGGGVTISGGEPLFQHEFLFELFKKLKEISIHTALDTSGFASNTVFNSIAPLPDLLLFDLKLLNPIDHLKYTGVPLQPILQNLEKAVSLKKEIIIRFPVIPNINDTDENVNLMIEYLKAIGLQKISLLPYHAIAKHKYDKFGIENKMLQTKELTRKDLVPLKKRLKDAGFIVSIGS